MVEIFLTYIYRVFYFIDLIYPYSQLSISSHIITVYFYHRLFFPDFEQRTHVKSFVGSITDTHVVNRACEGVNVVNRACEGVNVVNRACEGVNVVMHIASVIDWRMFPNYKALQEVNVTGIYY